MLSVCVVEWISSPAIMNVCKNVGRDYSTE